MSRTKKFKCALSANRRSASALLAGTVDATLMSYGQAKQAEVKGYRILAYSGDFVSALAANLETSDDKIQKITG